MKKIIVSLFTLAFIVLLTGCAADVEQKAAMEEEIKNYQSELEILKAENASLKEQLEEIESGADRLLNKATQQANNEDIEGLQETLAALTEKHPGTEEVAAVEALASGLAEQIEKQEKEKEERLKKATANLRKKTDEVTEWVFYHDKSTTEYVNAKAIYAYITQKDDKIRLRFRMQYSGERWIFATKYTIKTDNETYTFNADYNDVTRDNNGNGVWEYYDFPATDDTFKMIADIISSAKTIVRHSGDERYYDHTLTSKEKKAMQNILDGFEALGGNLPSN